MADNLDAFKNDNREAPEIDTTRKLRVGIIGCGGIAKSHAKTYLRMPDVEIVAGCDLVPGRAAEFMESFGVVGAKTDYKDHLEMLNDESLKLDCVSVCTYNRQHVPCAKAALERGINVLLEKPLCVTMEEAFELYRVEKASGKVLSIGFQPRFDESMKDIVRIVQSGELGKVYYIQTGGGRRRGIPVGNEMSFIRNDTAGIGALGDIGCYSLDMVLNAIGYPKPLTVSGFKSDFFGKDPASYRARFANDLDKAASAAEAFSVDDFGAAFIRLEGGIILDFRIAWAMNLNTPGDTIIYGTKGSLRIPSTDCWNGTVGGPMTIYHEVAGKQVETVIPLPTVKSDLWYGKVRSFLDACKNGGKAPVSIEQIIYNQAIISALVESGEKGREVTLDFSPIGK